MRRLGICPPNWREKEDRDPDGGRGYIPDRVDVGLADGGDKRRDEHSEPGGHNAATLADEASECAPTQCGQQRAEHEDAGYAELQSDADVRVFRNPAGKGPPAVDEDVGLGAESVAGNRTLLCLTDGASPGLDAAARRRQRPGVLLPG